MSNTPLAMALTVAGIGLLLYGLYQAYRLRQLLGRGTVKQAWDRLTVLIVFFIAGYLLFLGNLVLDLQQIDPHLLTAVVFFFGAIFVVATASYNRDAFGQGG